MSQQHPERNKNMQIWPDVWAQQGHTSQALPWRWREVMCVSCAGCLKYGSNLGTRLQPTQVSGQACRKRY